MKKLFRTTLLLLNMLFLPVLSAGEKDVSQALQGLETIHGFEADAEIKDLIPAFHALPARPHASQIQFLFEEQGLAQWSSRLSEYLSLSEILFESLSPQDQNARRSEYTRCRRILQTFQKDITRYTLAVHPGFSVLGVAPLQAHWNGAGVKIVVFDVFEKAALVEQKQRYPQALIGNPIVFGRPVELSHGNTVIDIILQLAPAAEIIPVAADAKSYAAAMQYLATQTDVDIINMSRAFPEDPVTDTVEAPFMEALRRWTQDGLLVKALGNTGTDLHGQLTRRRVEKGLGPVNTLTSYDLKLIRDLYQEEVVGLELFALNLGLFADDIALTATIPGAVVPVQQRTLAVPAEGIYSPTTDTFESGSSFAAPQISAWLALL
ncbi:MAG TPA: S8/S53 family peptidase, partial [Oligoflexus sp.]|uniref:S8/S53 family peptidase n=1 Tax=Oligoflexus sp. TaxID=1971216 RepID=UPI002D6A918D